MINLYPASNTTSSLRNLLDQLEKHLRSLEVLKQKVNQDLFVAMIQKVSNGAKIRNRYNQAPHPTQDTNGKVTNSQKTTQTRAKRSALSQQVTTKHI